MNQSFLSLSKKPMVAAAAWPRYSRGCRQLGKGGEEEGGELVKTSLLPLLQKGCAAWKQQQRGYLEAAPAAGSRNSIQ